MITEIASALSGFFGTIKPFIEEGFAQKYENEHKARMAEFEEILNVRDIGERGNRLGNFISKLLDTAGTPSGSIPGDYLIPIPLSHFRSLVVNTSESVKDDQLIARLQFKQGI